MVELAEGTGLENRRGCKSSAGSNPALSAILGEESWHRGPFQGDSFPTGPPLRNSKLTFLTKSLVSS